MSAACCAPRCGSLVQTHVLSVSLAGYAVSGYWLGLTLGRFLISPLAAKTGVSTGGMIYSCLAGVAAAAALAWLSPAAAVTSVALVLLGFFLGKTGAIAQSTGIWTLLPYMLALAAFQFAVWRPIARRIDAPLTPGGQPAAARPARRLVRRRTP